MKSFRSLSCIVRFGLLFCGLSCFSSILCESPVAGQDSTALQSPGPTAPQASEVKRVSTSNQDDTLQIIAGLTWESLKVIGQKHVDPPLRNQMILDGVTRLFPEQKQKLYRDIEEIRSREDLKAVLSQAVKESDIDLSKPESTLAIVNEFLRSVPGSPRLITSYQASINQQLAENRYVGIGIALRKEKLHTIISVAFRGGPAHDVGVKNEDRIISVDGESMVGKPIGTVVMALRGPKGSKVTAVVQQPGGAEREYEMTRGVVPIASVKGIAEKGRTDWEFALPSQKNVAYLEVTDITGSTAAELMTAARQIQRQKFAGLVIDLRNCFRADLHHARMVADTLIAGKKLGHWTNAEGKVTELRLRQSQVLPDLPISLIVSPAQSNEVKLLVQALVQFRSAKVIGQMNPAPMRVRGKIELASGLGSLENVYLGTITLAAQSGNDLAGGATHPDSTADRFRTGARKVDEQIKKAAQLIVQGQS